MQNQTQEPEALAKTYQCRHIFSSGYRCGSKSLRNEDFCFYHHKTRRPPARANAAHETPAQAAFDLTFPEDRPTIQISIGEVLRRIANNTIDPRRAGLLLYGLQIASLNLPPHPKPPAPPKRRPGRSFVNDFNRTPEPEESETIDTCENHPDHGLIAPIAEYVEPEEELCFAGKLIKELEEDDARRAAEAAANSTCNPGSSPHFSPHFSPDNTQSSPTSRQQSIPRSRNLGAPPSARLHRA